jgi:probable HAF family extracellular repeat protein
MDIIVKLLAILFLLGPFTANAQTYAVTEFASPYGGESSAVNNSGQVTGWLNNNEFLSNGFLYANGVLQALGSLGGVTSEGTGINDSGQVTGVASTTDDPTGLSYAFVQTNGVMQDLGTLGGVTSWGNGINASGQIVGYSSINTAGNYHAFLFADGVMQDLGTLGGANSFATAINNSGQIVGYSDTATGDQHAFLYSSGVMQDIGTLGGPNSYANAINGSGQIVGYSNTAAGAYNAFVYTNGVMQDLGEGTPYAVNDSGQIVGTGFLVEPDGSTRDLNTLIDPASPLKSFVTIIAGTAISNTGYIAAVGADSRNSYNQAFLLTLETNAPAAYPLVAGTLGQNGWYVTPTSISWTVIGYPTPTTSGCGNTSVPNTTGTSYTCTATNSLGTASQSVTIKEDTISPQVTIKSPRKGKSYALNERVKSSYTCLDAISGVATCSGTVPDGAKIPTATAGTHRFVVAGTDNAGNETTKSILYSVN